MESFRDLVVACPENLKLLLIFLWKTPQNIKYHPEGNVLKHTIIVTRRAIKTGNINLIFAALFHDLGKYETLEIRKGQPTAYGHEKISAEWVLRYSAFIRSYGANPETVHWIVLNHMRMKVWDGMTDKKKVKLMEHKEFKLLQAFAKIDKSGYYLH